MICYINIDEIPGIFCFFFRYDFLFLRVYLFIQLTRLKFELTNQDLAGGKSSAVLHSLYDKKSIEVGQLFPLETASNIHEKEIYISKNQIKM